MLETRGKGQNKISLLSLQQKIRTNCRQDIPNLLTASNIPSMANFSHAILGVETTIYAHTSHSYEPSDKASICVAYCDSAVIGRPLGVIGVRDTDHSNPTLAIKHSSEPLGIMPGHSLHIK